jgi:hypothetical protein
VKHTFRPPSLNDAYKTWAEGSWWEKVVCQVPGCGQWWGHEDHL